MLPTWQEYAYKISTFQLFLGRPQETKDKVMMSATIIHSRITGSYVIPTLSDPGKNQCATSVLHLKDRFSVNAGTQMISLVVQSAVAPPSSYLP